jgi:hypothetical protein
MTRFRSLALALAFAFELAACVDPTDGCGGAPHFCGDGACNSDENASTCPDDCDASLTIENDSTWPVSTVYVWPCGSDTGSNQLAAPIAAGAEITVEDITSGCYSFRAINSDATESWESDEQQLAALQRGWTWTLTTSNARTPS